MPPSALIDGPEGDWAEQFKASRAAFEPGPTDAHVPDHSDGSPRWPDLGSSPSGVCSAHRISEADPSCETCFPTPRPVICVCGHTAADHFRGTGNCMFSTVDETWACDCHEYRPAQERP